MPFNLKFRHILSILAVLHGITLFGIDPDIALNQYVHQSWEIDKGLPQNSILSIEQTSDGYLWLGTFEGLVRFDGIRFEVFHKRNTEAIKKNGILCLCEDKAKNLWVGTNGGGLLCKKGDKFSLLTTEDGLSNNYVTALLEDSEGNLWIGTREGISVYRDGKFQIYKTGQGLPSNHILSLCEDDLGNIWAGTLGGGLAGIHGDVVSIYNHENGLTDESVLALLFDKKTETLWIGTSQSGLFMLKGGRLSPYESAETHLKGEIRSLLMDREGSFWVGSGWYGVFRLMGNTVERFSNQDGLTNNNVTALFEDKEGGIWMGTYRGGLNYFKSGKCINYGMDNGLTSDQVRCVYCDSSGVVWIGTSGGGLNWFKDGKFDAYTTKNGLSFDHITSLFETKDRRLLIGTYGGGISILQDGKFQVYSTENGLSENVIRAVYEDKQGNIWIGTNGKGVDILKPDGRFEHMTTEDGLSNGFVYSIFEDRKDVMWLGTYAGGVNRIENGQISCLKMEDGLSSNFVWSISQDNTSTLWFGTNDGLNALRDQKIVSYTTDDGMFNDVIFHVLHAGEKLWLASNLGIYFVNKSDLFDFDKGKIQQIPYVSLGKSEGMRTMACNGPGHPAGCIDLKGNIWFPTTQGVSVVDAGKNRKNIKQVPVFLEKVLVDGVDIKIEKEKVLLPGTERIEFHFTALNFMNAEKIKFRYMLEGQDKNWIEADTRRIAYYTNISPGGYTFRVTACNEDFVWSETGAEFSFYLKPLFYQTKLFKVVLFFVLVLILSGLFYLRTNSMRKRQKELEEVVAERTRELKEINTHLNEEIIDRKASEKEKERLIVDLKEALTNIKKLKGLLPICSSCKNIRDDRGYWHQVEKFFRDHTDVDFSHSICPDCVKILYPGMKVSEDD